MRNLIDFKSSVVGGLENFNRISELLAAGENVIMLANHQTEADPGALKYWLLPRPLCCSRGFYGKMLAARGLD